MSIKKWRLPQPMEEQAAALAEALSLPQHICSILAARGHSDPQEAREFLEGMTALPDPFLLKDMDKAVERISNAVEYGQFICIYGDYDCDGITSTALLYTYFQDVGARVMYYIPDRDEEGYGLNNMAIDRLSSLGVDLIVTVDNGVSAIDEIAYAAQLGIDVVVTDHHQPREILPKAVAVVDPHRKDCPYPYKHLCGVGVAFKLICAMEYDLDGSMMLEHFAGITALGTIADVVELTGENRAIVKAGLLELSQTENLGLQALMELAGLSGKRLDSSSVAFGIVPRLNAAGRIGKAALAVELLLTDDPERAMEIAAEINGYNETRKDLVDQILLDIDKMCARHPELLEQRLLILSGEGWHHGVIGIAASKLVERYSKPCLLISEEGEEARGSARSVEGYSIIKAISRNNAWLSRYGGHDQAAGLSLRSEDIPAFREALLADAGEEFDIMPVDALSIDLILPAEQINLKAVQQLRCLEPFGCGNEAPMVMIPDCRIEAIYPLSEDRHIRLRCSSKGKVFQALYFGMSSKRFPYIPGDVVDLAASLDMNEYNGDTSVSIKIRSLRPSGIPQDKLVVGRQYYEKFRRGEELSEKIRNYITPTRDDIAVIYRFMQRMKCFPHGYDLLWCRLGGKMNYCKMRLCLDIMDELFLLFRQDQGGEDPTLIHPVKPGKADLEQSSVLRKLKGGEVCASFIR
ncbi:MAG: single-stranded-DNA-specific exonuclease RecJ [Oscillospiraceae bacterium]|nr:single-stranded-DNA-specific exonuclease RecJ [Oscillospiraceae bacterium]